jgi:GxxExxY protein
MEIDAADSNELTGTILNAAIEVHKTLGPGLLESSYLPPFTYELGVRKLQFATQRDVPLIYKGIRLKTAFRIDLIVEDIVVVEVKSHAATLPVHQAQLLTYLKITNAPVGLLINFNVPKLRDGVKRVFNTRYDHELLNRLRSRHESRNANLMQPDAATIEPA